jgi:predicted restriction endonuclease
MKAIAEFDRLTRDRFLAKYHFRPATTYFLSRNGELYDAKAIVGAAYGFATGRRALEWDDFGSHEVTTKRWLEALGFPIVTRRSNGSERPARASEHLRVGDIYTRAHLKKQFSITDATINNGVFKPDGFNSVWLFVTEEKTADRIPYKDQLKGDSLLWQGQRFGRTDHLISEHRTRDLELLVFYRAEKYEHPDAGFTFEGVFEYVRKSGMLPTSFVLRRVSARSAMEAVQQKIEAGPAFDANSVEDAREKTLGSIVRRRGRDRFRAALLRAYSGRCAVTRCDFREALEAAHIRSYMGTRTDHVTNGLLLRADIHTLFDLYWITIHPKTFKVLAHPSLCATSYRLLIGDRILLPRAAYERPEPSFLEWHFERAQASRALR